MGGEPGGPGGEAPGLGHGIQGGSGGLRPGLGHGVQRGVRGLGINSFCDRFSYVFCGFSCISQPIYPTQDPLFPTGPASLLVVIRGFPPHIIDTRA